ncbi:hypothetical protein Ddc_22124 [Ditylenchus destructor]|nr:hypothetical protein Ddc_22124 [Ditylenchus destructor]
MKEIANWRDIDKMDDNILAFKKYIYKIYLIYDSKETDQADLAKLAIMLYWILCDGNNVKVSATENDNDIFRNWMTEFMYKKFNGKQAKLWKMLQSKNAGKVTLPHRLNRMFIAPDSQDKLAFGELARALNYKVYGEYTMEEATIWTIIDAKHLEIFKSYVSDMLPDKEKPTKASEIMRPFDQWSGSVLKDAIVVRKYLEKGARILQRQKRLNRHQLAKATLYITIQVHLAEQKLQLDMTKLKEVKDKDWAAEQTRWIYECFRMARNDENEMAKKLITFAQRLLNFLDARLNDSVPINEIVPQLIVIDPAKILEVRLKREEEANQKKVTDKAALKAKEEEAGVEAINIFDELCDITNYTYVYLQPEIDIYYGYLLQISIMEAQLQFFTQFGDILPSWDEDMKAVVVKMNKALQKVFNFRLAKNTGNDGAIIDLQRSYLVIFSKNKIVDIHDVSDGENALRTKLEYFMEEQAQKTEEEESTKSVTSSKRTNNTTLSDKFRKAKKIVQSIKGFREAKKAEKGARKI